MNKKELIDYVVLAVGAGGNTPRATIEKTMDAVIDGIEAGLVKDGEVALKGFGTFKVKHSKARQGRNPKTGEAIQIAASSGVNFKPGKGLKDAVNG